VGLLLDLLQLGFEKLFLELGLPLLGGSFAGDTRALVEAEQLAIRAEHVALVPGTVEEIKEWIHGRKV
jgi:hypothetical protein